MSPIFIFGLAALTFAGGFGLRILLASRSRKSAEHAIHADIEAAERRAKEIIIEARDKATAIVDEAQRDERDRKQELRRTEERLMRKEDSLEEDRKRVEAESARAREATDAARKIEQDAREAERRFADEAKAEREKIAKEFERIAGLTREEARAAVVAEFEASHRDELAQLLARLEREKQTEIEKKSVEAIVAALQRCSRDCVNDVTTSEVHLPSDDMKGKIIGREGRNIRAFERLTGVEVIVDESPDGLIISSFDPMRREHAKMALEKLLKDGRIQPAKIEEKVEEARRELDERIRKIGEEAMYEVGIVDLPKELVQVLGRLNFRTSYGQNVLQHSIEMAHIAGMMAGELHLNAAVAKKAALLHDIGKALDQETEGTHVEIGRKLLKKFGIDEAVIRAMESHHDEYPYSSPEAYIVGAADVISAGRPGARRDTLEKYLKRMEEIEKVVNSFDGVKQSYAVAAGREVRVFVVPEKIDDFGAFQIAKQIAAKLTQDVQFPGEIKVTVMREVKAVEYAR